MERSKKDKILNMIKEIEKKNLDIEKYLTSLAILSRNEMLKEISRNIIENNILLQEITGSMEKVSPDEVKVVPNEIQHKIDGFISKIQKNPTKKVIYLREFLGIFQEISEKDKNVILQSLKDEKNQEILKEKMASLAKIFKKK